MYHRPLSGRQGPRSIPLERGEARLKTRARLVVGSIATMAVLSAVIGVAPAGAHPSPPGCTSNSLDLVLGKDRTSVRNGEVVTYTVSAQNTAGTPCDVTGVTITLTLPASNGTPTGQTVTLQTAQDYPANAGLRVVGTVPYTVALDPGVTNAVVQATATGILHDNQPDDLAQITKTLGTTSTQPHLTVTESVSPPSGTAPLDVTHTYQVVNDSTTPVPIGSVTLTDTVCAN